MKLSLKMRISELLRHLQPNFRIYIFVKIQEISFNDLDPKRQLTNIKFAMDMRFFFN